MAFCISLLANKPVSQIRNYQGKKKKKILRAKKLRGKPVNISKLHHLISQWYHCKGEINSSPRMCVPPALVLQLLRRQEKQKKIKPCYTKSGSISVVVV